MANLSITRDNDTAVKPGSSLFVVNSVPNLRILKSSVDGETKIAVVDIETKTHLGYHANLQAAAQVIASSKNVTVIKTNDEKLSDAMIKQICKENVELKAFIDKLGAELEATKAELATLKTKRGTKKAK